MSLFTIHTEQAPKAVGPYSQAVRAGNLVFLSGQLGLEPTSGCLMEDFAAQTHQVFRNLRTVCQAAGGEFRDVVRLGVFLTDMSNFALFNEIMCEYFVAPFPARVAVEVAALPRSGMVEAEATMYLM